MDIIIRDNDDNIVEQYTESLKRTLEDTASVYELTGALLDMYEQVTEFRDFLQRISPLSKEQNDLQRVVIALTNILEEVDL